MQPADLATDKQVGIEMGSDREREWEWEWEWQPSTFRSRAGFPPTEQIKYLINQEYVNSFCACVFHFICALKLTSFVFMQTKKIKYNYILCKLFMSFYAFVTFLVACQKLYFIRAPKTKAYPQDSP